jgi:hypothetical protein
VSPRANAAAAAAIALVPGIFLVGVVAWWSADNGGYDATTWYPGALLLLGLAVVTVFGRNEATRMRSLWLPGGFLAALTVWSFASIGWATVKGDAWDGANRTALYLIVFFLVARWSWDARDAAFVLTALSTVIAAIGLVTLARAARSGDPGTFLVDSRLSAPLGYPNAAVALYLLAFWPALVLATRRELALPLRLIQIVVATICLELSVIPQSRGATYTLPLVLLVAFALVPARLRLLGGLLPVGLAAGISLHRLWQPYAARSTHGDVHPALVGALQAVLVSIIAVAAVAALLLALDARWRPSGRAAVVLRRSAVAATVVACLGAGAYAVHRVPHPVARAEAQWTSFRHGREPTTASTHFSGLGSNRYDFWRVAWVTFKHHPVGGVGVDNFATQYLRLRHGYEQPRYPHSLELRLLSGTGIVGALLFLGFLVAVALALVRGPEISPFARTVSTASLLVFVSWLAHGSVDWLWEFPSLSVAAFLGVGLAVAVANPPSKAAAASGRPRSRWAAAAGAVAALVLAASFLPPWLAAHEVQSAAASWREDPPAALAQLHRASRLNPLSELPDLYAGAIASQLGDRQVMGAAFRSALRRNPESWYAALELGALAGVEGDRRTAVRYLTRALRLDPLDYLGAQVLQHVREGDPLTLAQIDKRLLARELSGQN